MIKVLQLKSKTDVVPGRFDMRNVAWLGSQGVWRDGTPKTPSMEDPRTQATLVLRGRKKRRKQSTLNDGVDGYGSHRELTCSMAAHPFVY